jgi:hypothetical protein
VRAFPAAVTGKVTKKDLKAARIQGRRAAAGIERVYNKLYLDPSRAAETIRSHFEAAAARSFLRAKLRLPGGFTKVQITYRALHIGVDASSARKAVATVSVLLRGVRNSTRLKLKHESTLWLERVHRSWKVLAFHAAQEP